MPKSIDKMSYAELAAMQARIEQAKVERQNSERTALKQKLTDMAKAAGFTLEELFGKGSRKGTVAVKFRDPKNPSLTWTGRGRMPRWLVAATKNGKAKRDDFLV
jgi:DNA-binding protein H-NS